MFGLALLVAAWLAACSPQPQTASTAALPSAVRDNTLRQVPLGLCEDYPEETRTLDEARRDFAVLRTGGVGVLRVSIGWDGVEPEKDHCDLAFWDAFVELAAEARITLIPYVAYTPRWNSDGGAEDYWKTPPRDLAEFGELMQLLATRYRGRIHSWEIWNEPDNRDYWLGTAAQYGALLKTGAAAVHAADPALEVVLGGLAGGVPFLRELFEEQQAADSVDVVNLHSYYETWNPNPLETLPSYVEEVSAIVARHGRRQPIWMAEVGYSDWRPAAARAVAPRYGYEHSTEFQAVMLVRTVALLFAKPAVSLVAWYELKDPRASAAMIGDDNNRHLGVMTESYRPKPAFDALSLMNRLFHAGFRPADAELRVLPAPAPGSELELHGFLTADRELVLIAWLRTRSLTRSPAPPLPASNGAAATLVDTRRGHVQVTAPHPTRSTPVWFDERGRRLGTGLEARALAGRTELSFDLSGGEVRIIELPIALP
jgi:hypothetical protein